VNSSSIIDVGTYEVSLVLDNTEDFLHFHNKLTLTLTSSTGNTAPYFLADLPDWSLQATEDGTYYLPSYFDDQSSDTLTLTVKVNGSTSYPSFL